MTEDSGSPNAFFSDHPEINPLTQVNKTMSGSTAGGVVESVNMAIVSALREQAKRTDLRINGAEPYIDLDYPLREEQYPGIWVSFAISKFARAGLAHEVAYQIQDEWVPIQTWTYDGRVTLFLVATHRLDRDRLVDGILAMLAFARPPENWTSKPQKDTKQYRSFITALNENEYVSITPSLDVFTSSGQNQELGVPWDPNRWAFTDTWSFTVHGQTQVEFLHDGAYTLSSVQLSPTMASTIPDEFMPLPPASPPIGGHGIGMSYTTRPYVPPERTL